MIGNTFAHTAAARESRNADLYVGFYAHSAIGSNDSIESFFKRKRTIAAKRKETVILFTVSFSAIDRIIEIIRF